MNNKKLTAVEWLIDQLLNNKGMVVISTSTFYFNEEVVKKALEMDKEQSIENMSKMQMIENVDFDGVTFSFNPKQYYEETYENSKD